MVRPNALAVLRLSTSSNLVGCSTGRSAGLASLRTTHDSTETRTDPLPVWQSRWPFSKSFRQTVKRGAVTVSPPPRPTLRMVARIDVGPGQLGKEVQEAAVVARIRTCCEEGVVRRRSRYCLR